MTDIEPITALKDYCTHMERAGTAWGSDIDGFQAWCRERDKRLSALGSVAPALLARFTDLEMSLAQFQLTMAV
jgi:hypothetical protein